MVNGLMDATMDDGAAAVAGEFGEVVADLLALLEAYRMDGGVALPVDVPAAPGAGGAGAGGGRPMVPPMTRAPLPLPRPSTFAAPVPAAPPPPTPTARVPSASIAAPPAVARTPSPGPDPAPGGSGLLGRWAAVLADPAEELEKLFRETPPFCAGCGSPAPRGIGPVRQRLVVLAAPMSGAAEEMFGKMLVKVLSLEPTDVFLLPTPACVACREVVRRQVEIVKARMVLAMGRDSTPLTGGTLGGWSRWANAEVVTTFHPAEILEDGARRAPAFEHLKGLARRL